MTNAPAYRYLLCDLLTDQPLADLPLTGVSFERRISRVGSLSATLEAANPATAALARTVHDNVGRSALYVYRDGQLWWGGIPWTADASQGERGAIQLSVQAATFDSYAHRRVFRQAIGTSLTFTQADQGRIIPYLWRHLQGRLTPIDARGDIGVVAEDQLTGVLRDRAYYNHEFSSYGKLIESLGDVEDGPEHTIDVYLDAAGNRVKELRVAQSLGIDSPRVVFQRALRGGGRVLEWSDTADVVDSGTVFQARGDAPNGNVGQDEDPLLSDIVEATSLLGEGWPLLDVTVDRPGVIELGTLNEWAYAEYAARAGRVRAYSYTVQVGNTGWSPSRLGDPVRVKLADLWHTGATDLTVRPVGCKVSAAEAGKAEAVELLLGDD